MEARSSSRIAGGKPGPVRKLKKDKVACAPSIPPAELKAAAQPKTVNPKVRAHLIKGIAELQGLHNLLLNSEVDAHVLADFRDALNRVRNTAWAAQQYVVRKEADQDSTSVLSLLAGERVRAAYQICQALSDDLTENNIELQRGSLVQLHGMTKTLTGQLKRVIDKLG
jgi:hypothetical protein